MAGGPDGEETRRRMSWAPATCAVLRCGARRRTTPGRDGRRCLRTYADAPACLTTPQKPKVGLGGRRPNPDPGSASRAHLFAGWAAVAAADAGVAGLVADGAGGTLAGVPTVAAGAVPAGFAPAGAGAVLAGLATAGAGGDVPTTVSECPGEAGSATPMTLPSESRRKAADCAGTIPMPAALLARLAGDLDASRD